jgi:Glycosyl transferase family 2
VTTDAPLGCFELSPNGSLSGWLTDENGDPAPVVVRINGVLAATLKAATVRPARSWPWERREGISRRGGFKVRLRTNPDDRVEVFHGVTGQQVRRVVRRIAGPHWRPRVALIAPVKQETPHLLEWIAYHRALGVEAFVLGDNGGSDHTSELLQALDAAGLVMRLDWQGEIAFQLRFDIDAIQRMCGLADVCSITDADEFLRPLGGRQNISAAIAEIFARPEVSAAALGWATYGSSGRIEPGVGLVTERFTHRAPDDHVSHRVVKTIVRPERLAGMVNPHQVRLTSGEYVDDCGNPVRWSRIPAAVKSSSWNSLRVDHFVTKSRREFETKVKRGRSDAAPGVADRNEAFFVSRDRNETFDPMPADFVDRTKREMTQMREQLLGFVSSASPIARLLHAQ